MKQFEAWLRSEPTPIRKTGIKLRPLYIPSSRPSCPNSTQSSRLVLTGICTCQTGSGAPGFLDRAIPEEVFPLGDGASFAQVRSHLHCSRVASHCFTRRSNLYIGFGGARVFGSLRFPAALHKRQARPFNKWFPLAFL